MFFLIPYISNFNYITNQRTIPFKMTLILGQIKRPCHAVEVHDKYIFICKYTMKRLSGMKCCEITKGRHIYKIKVSDHEWRDHAGSGQSRTFFYIYETNVEISWRSLFNKHPHRFFLSFIGNYEHTEVLIFLMWFSYLNHVPDIYLLSVLLVFAVFL
jgi:hypothetical protein